MEEQTLLKEIGLSEKESKIYQIMLKIGAVPASKIILTSEMPRGTVYEILNQLTKKGLIEQFIDKKKTYFRIKHPLALKNYLAEKSAQIKQTETKLESVMSDFVSTFNLSQNRPGVEFYEGEQGMQKVLDDSLKTDSEILTYVDIETIMKFIPKINKQYVTKREKLGIKKRGIVIDTPLARKYLKDYHTKITDSKLIDAGENPAKTVMQIYDNKISYITLDEKNMIGLIITHPNIAQMHKNLFEYTWNNLPEIEL